MAMRAEVLELVQFGKESTLGTAVDADKKLFGFKLDLDPNIPTEEDRAQGYKSPVGVVVGKEHTVLNFKGSAAFNEMAYVFSSILEAAAITTPGGATNARLWTFEPNDADADTFESFTVQKGSSLGASQVAGVRFDEAELTFTPDKTVEFSGKAFGKAISDGITMTASPTAVTHEAMSPRGVNVYMATSVAGLGSGQIKPLQAKLSIKNRHTQVFSLDSSETSWQDTVERPLEIMGQITVPQDSTANGYITTMRAATKKYLKFSVTGSLIETSQYYGMDIIIPFVFRNPKRNPVNDVHCGVYDLMAIHDPTAGYTINATIKTAMTAL